MEPLQPPCPHEDGSDGQALSDTINPELNDPKLPASGLLVRGDHKGGYI